MIMDKDASIAYLKGDLLHYSYNSISEHVIQQQNFAELAAREAFKKGRRSTMVHVVINPAYTFIRKFFFQLGFLDGYYGLVISYISAKGNYWKYARLRQLKS